MAQVLPGCKLAFDPAADGVGQLGALLVMGLAAAEATLVLAIVLVVFNGLAPLN